MCPLYTEYRNNFQQLVVKELGASTYVVVRFHRPMEERKKLTRHIYICIKVNSNNEYSALGPVWQEPEPSQATSMALIRCILGTFLGVACHCFPPRWDFPTFAAKCLHVLNDARDPSSERWNYGRETSGNLAYMTSQFTPLGTFYMPQIYDMGPTALLPLRWKTC
jgi:hypothetical protein